MDRESELMKLKRILNALGLMCAFGIGAGIWLLGVQPTAATTRDLTHQHAKLTQFLQTHSSLQFEHERNQSLLQRQRSRTQEFLSRIPQESRESDFMDLLSEMASQSGVTLSNFRPQYTQPGEFIGTSQVRIQGAGSYQNLIDFLNRLRQSPRMHRIRNLELSVARSGEEICSVELTLELFFNFRSAEA